MGVGYTIVSYNTTYDALIQIMADYYGTQSIGWEQINAAGLTDANLINSINGIPGYHAIANQDGTVRVFYQSKTYGTQSASSAAASAIDSNTQAGTASSGNAMTVQAPAQTQYVQQAGQSYKTFEASKGGLTGGMSGTQFFLKSVVPAIAAAGVGITLGKTIDSALYNFNPDFWDSHGMSTLNPETWNSITSNDTLLGAVFNMLFGLQPNGNVQPYVDEKAFAYLALYMQLNNVFADGSMYPSKDGIILSSGFNRYHPPTTRTQIVNGQTVGYWIGDSDVYYTLTYDTTTELVYMQIASETRRHGITIYTTESGSGQYFQLLATIQQTYNGKTYYTNGTSIGGWEFPGVPVITPTVISPVGESIQKCIGYILLYGTSSSTVPGIGSQTGATLPLLNNDMTVDDVLAALRSQYPSLWNNAVSNDVAQPDGTVTTYTYIPTAYPQAQNSEDTQPTGDGQQSSQTKPYYDASDLTGNEFDWMWGIIDPTLPDDPEDAEDESESGDGTTPTPIIPTGSASALWKIYNPSQAQLDAFGGWLWSSDFVDQLLKVFNDPMQAIIGLHKVFVTPIISGSGPIKVGYLTSNASANYVSNQYVTVDCGTVTLYEKFGNVYDYDPFVKLRLFLPFIGIVDLSTADVMRGTINVKYHVDVLTGSCLAEVSITRDSAGGILYTFSGNCAVQYPVSSGSYVGIITGLLGIGAGLVAGGFSAPALLTAGASVGRMHTDVQHSGNIGSNSGAMGGKKPYLIIERTQNKMPASFKEVDFIDGYEYCTLSEVHGFVRVKEIKLNAPCTLQEKEEIYELLKIGIYT